MSLQITMQVICDSCGIEIHRTDNVKITRIESQWSKWRFPRRNFGEKLPPPAKFILLERYAKASLTYCTACADKVS